MTEAALAFVALLGMGALGDPGEVIRDVHRSPAGERAYRLYLPPGAREGPALPLVVMLHGCTQDADDVATGTRLDEHARRRGVAVLYPEQSEGAHPNRCWNWYEPAHQRRGEGEPAILQGMIREVVERYGMDGERVFVAGISAGGAMALVLAAAHPEVVRRAAVHSGVAYGAARSMEEALEVLAGRAGDPPPELADRLLAAMGDRARPVPLLVLHGDADGIVSPRNADWILVQWEGLMEAVGDGAVARERDPPRSGAEWASRIEVLRDGTGRTVFELRLLRELEHAWSGGSPEGTFTRPGGLDATEAILDFFLECDPASRRER